MIGRYAGLCLLILSGVAPAARGQADPGSVERLERSLEQIRRQTRVEVVRDVPAGQRALLDYGGYLTLGYLSFDDPAGNNRAFRGYDLTGYGRVNLDNAHEFYARGRATYRDFNPKDSFQNEPDHLEGHLEEAYYRFDLRHFQAAYRGRPIDDNLTVQVGRQFETWAGGLVLSQYMDGGRFVIDRGAVTVEALAAVTAEDLTVDFDSSRPYFEKETRRAFYGATASIRLGPHKPFVYGLVQRDQNGGPPPGSDVLPTRHRYNSYYLGVGSTGGLTDRLAYGVEAVYEGGASLSNSFDPATSRGVPQREEDVAAWAAEVRLDYLFNDPRRTRLGVGLLLAGGDTDRTSSSNALGGNRAGTDDHAFNALGFVNDGLAFSPTFSNLVVARASVSTYPLAGTPAFDKLQCGVEVFTFGKLRRAGPIDEPTAGGRYLGVEPDLFANWQVADDVTLVLRYGIFFPGGAIPSDERRQFFYAGVTYAF